MCNRTTGEDRREAFTKDGLWQLRKVDYIDGVADLYVSKGSSLTNKEGIFVDNKVILHIDIAKDHQRPSNIFLQIVESEMCS